MRLWLLAFALGELVNEAGTKEIFEEDVLTGESVREGGARGHAAAYGTADEIRARYRSYAATVETLVSRGSGKMDAYRRAAREHRVSQKTIQRAVKIKHMD